jgi:hypothetical protein
LVVSAVAALARSKAALLQHRPCSASSDVAPSSHSLFAWRNQGCGSVVAGDAGVGMQTFAPVNEEGGLTEAPRTRWDGAEHPARDTAKRDKAATPEIGRLTTT